MMLFSHLNLLQQFNVLNPNWFYRILLQNLILNQIKRQTNWIIYGTPRTRRTIRGRWYIWLVEFEAEDRGQMTKLVWVGVFLFCLLQQMG